MWRRSQRSVLSLVHNQNSEGQRVCQCFQAYFQGPFHDQKKTKKFPYTLHCQKEALFVRFSPSSSSFSFVFFRLWNQKLFPWAKL